MKICKVGILGLGLSLSGLCFADSLSDADKLFAQRNKGANDSEKFQSSMKALNAYKAIYNNKGSSEPVKLRAFVGMGRLALFAGGLLEDADRDARHKVLDECIDVSKDEAKHSKLQEHHYFLLACTAGRAKISDTAKRGWLAMKLKTIYPKAVETSTVSGQEIGGFEGGGILRAAGGLLANRAANIFGLYKPKDSLKYTTAAIATIPNMYPPFEEKMGGKRFYENFHYQAQAMLAVGMTHEDRTKGLEFVTKAAEILGNTVDSINEAAESGDLPKGREPESLIYANLMTKLKEKIDACSSNSNWNSCLESKLND